MRIGQLVELFPSIGAVVAAIIVWEAVVDVFKIPLYLLPKPSIIFINLVSGQVNWTPNAYVTLYETMAGFALSMAVGIPLSIGIVYSSWLNRILYPLVLALQVVPKVALAPIIFIMFGFGYFSRILVVFLVAFFPILIDTVGGLNALDPDFVDLLRSLKASTFQIFRMARMPNALPYIFNGLKVSITLSLIGAVVAEFVQANAGLGYIALTALLQFGTVIAFASITVLTLMGFALYASLLVFERFAIPWYIRSKQLRV